MKTILSLTLLLFTGNLLVAQETCPSRKDTIYPGMLEEICPIDASKISLVTCYMDKRFKVTADQEKAVYTFKIPQYENSGSKFLIPKLGKALSHSPMLNNVTEGELDGELIYRAKGSYFHLTFNKGILWAISKEGAVRGHWQSYTDLGLLFADSPRWIRSENYDLQGRVKSITYWYYCGDAVTMQDWKKYY